MKMKRIVDHGVCHASSFCMVHVACLHGTFIMLALFLPVAAL
jgi:hypothetical protein